MSTASKTTGRSLDRIAHAIVEAFAETVGKLVDHRQVRPGALRRWQRTALMKSFNSTRAVLRVALGKSLGNATATVLFSAADAATIAGIRRMATPEQIDQARGRRTLEDADLEALAELGAAFCETLTPAVNEIADQPTEISLRSHGTLALEEDPHATLGSSELAGIEFALQLGTYPESRGAIAFDLPTAELLNGGPLAASGEDEEIPQAPIVGRLAAFLTDQSLFTEVRRSCRRTGLELERFGRREIPNPAAHRGDIVVLDVPADDDRRFDWCQRLKSYDASIRVVLLLHHPSRARVLRSFKARADAVLGCPTSEAALSPKLQELLEASGEPPADGL